jgi:hypothetical protein
MAARRRSAPCDDFAEAEPNKEKILDLENNPCPDAPVTAINRSMIDGL